MSFSRKLVIVLLPLVIILSAHVWYLSTQKLPVQKTGTIFFIGSSRTAQSINDQLINDACQFNVTNYGMSGATLYHNFHLANKIIEQQKPNAIYVELSPIIYTYNLSMDHYNLLNYDYISGFPLQQQGDLLMAAISRRINISSTLKNLYFGTSDNFLGYVPSQQNDYRDIDSFLKSTRLTSDLKIDTSEYHHLISNLLEQASEKDVTVKFYLPFTFLRKKERFLVKQLFNELATEHKVDYSDEFFKKLVDSKHLRDKNHLNSKGAQVVSEYFAKMICESN
jgi:hypothetical protein